MWHLQGGILNYLESVPVEESRWRGECFVFDSRVAVNHSLSKGVTISATPADIPSLRLKRHQNTTEKVSHAPAVTSICRPTQQARFTERQKQVDLASARGQQHIGAPPPARQASADSLQSADPLVEKPSGIKQAD